MLVKLSNPSASVRSELCRPSCGQITNSYILGLYKRYAALAISEGKIQLQDDALGPSSWSRLRIREFFVPIGAWYGRQSLRPAGQGDLQVPRFHTSAQYRALSCMGLSFEQSSCDHWHYLLDYRTDNIVDTRRSKIHSLLHLKESRKEQIGNRNGGRARESENEWKRENSKKKTERDIELTLTLTYTSHFPVFG